MENALRACCKGIKIGKILVHRCAGGAAQQQRARAMCLWARLHAEKACVLGRHDVGTQAPACNACARACCLTSVDQLFVLLGREKVWSTMQRVGSSSQMHGTPSKQAPLAAEASSSGSGGGDGTAPSPAPPTTHRRTGSTSSASGEVTARWPSSSGVLPLRQQVR